MWSLRRTFYLFCIISLLSFWLVRPCSVIDLTRTYTGCQEVWQIELCDDSSKTLSTTQTSGHLFSTFSLARDVTGRRLTTDKDPFSPTDAVSSVY